MKQVKREGKPLTAQEQKRYDAGLKLFSDLQDKANEAKGVVFYDGSPIKANQFYKVDRDGEVLVDFGKYSSETWIDVSGYDCPCLDYPVAIFKKKFNEVFKIWKEIK
jgi:hypothetical protein